jgi:ATP-dependent DNA helicase RecQ
MTISPARPARRSPQPEPSSQTEKPDAVLQALQKYWGYADLRPLQRAAIAAGIEQRDSLVVLPTGGGKSLCYQVPPLIARRIDVVVSPLISLMKDQVDALRACGYPATALHGGLDDEERRRELAAVGAGKYRLVFAAPERLLMPWFLGLMERLKVNSFAVDEAHCISQWGHDFRPEYRRLAQLKQRFPGASVHAFTATATPRVRQDISRQLGLKDPEVLVGRFDRPNLVYRVVPRTNLEDQVYAAIRRHAGEAVIVYCISRNDTEAMAQALRRRGIKAAAYHAGMNSSARARAQEEFAKERLDVIVATVAFGMGIDRSNVRCVIHAAMPKSLEHYQQETGRAGRDGLEAECILFFSPADFYRWEYMLQRGGPEAGVAPEVRSAQLDLLQAMRRFAMSRECRHRALSRYFGQSYEPPNCEACDVCFGEEQAFQEPPGQPARGGGEASVREQADSRRNGAGEGKDDSWEGVDHGLYEHLRELRRLVAAEKNVAAFIVFGDITLRELAKVRPTSLRMFGAVRGVGDRKLAELGPRFLAAIQAYCRDKGLSTDVASGRTAGTAVRPRVITPKQAAFDLFDQGRTLDEVAASTGRTRSTASSYLEEYLAERKPASIDRWIPAQLYDRIDTAAAKLGGPLLRPVFEALGGEIGYDEIRIVMRHAGRR